MKYFPLYFHLSRFKILVVGGGEIALSKVSILRRATKSITVIAPKIDYRIKKQLLDFGCKVRIKVFLEEDLEDHSLLIAATNNDDVNREICMIAKQHGVIVNAVDNKSACDFIFPAIVDRSPITVAICSEGAAPTLATKIRNDLEIHLNKNLGKLASLFEKQREYIKSSIPNIIRRRIFFEKLLDKIIVEVEKPDGLNKAKESLAEELLSFVSNSEKTGKVYLVGAGPGDPELLTLKAVKVLGCADVILYDRLVNPQILDYARREACLINVGKQKGNHPIPQKRINSMLVDYALEGKTVIRLKGGDPLIFGRGGEEIDCLHKNNIAVEVIPGITAATGAAASCQIPLTLRGISSSCIFLTHFDERGEINIDPTTDIAKQTIVFYMSSENLISLCHKLLNKGLDINTPIAVIENATLSEQKIHIATLGNPVSLLVKRDRTSPSIIVVGDVIKHCPHANQDESLITRFSKNSNTSVL